MPTTDKELLFLELIQTDLQAFLNETQKLIQQDKLTKPTVFLSYAWPSSRYNGYIIEKDIQTWLLRLYESLSSLGVNVLLDIKTMALGTNIDLFMQDGVASCDKVLIIGTQTYKTRSEENTNVKREVDHIKIKIQQKGTGCVIPILYRGDFRTSLPDLGQILGTDCSDEFLYHENLPVLIEGLFELLSNSAYQLLKQKYHGRMNDIKVHGLSDVAVIDFSQNRAQQARAGLEMQREVVYLMLERNAIGHPDYIAQPAGSQSLSVKMLYDLKHKYSQCRHVHALFGQPLALEGLYINVQMLYQVLEEKKETDFLNEAKSSHKKGFQDTRVTSFETIFSKKEPLAIHQLFTPAKQLLNDKQRTNEAKPDSSPNFILLQGSAGIGKTTFVNFVTREWAMGRLWPEYNWVFSVRFRDLRSSIFQQAYGKETWKLEDWIYTVHFAAQMNKSTFQSLWTWVIKPDLNNNKVLFILDGYDEAPLHHPCEQALSDLLNSDTPKILTSRPYGLSDLPRDRRELEIVGFIDENVDKYVGLYFEQDQNKAKSITEGLRLSPALWGNAHIPVTLNVLCGILENEADIGRTLANLNTMSGLYEAMEVSLLERAFVNTSGKEKEHAQQLSLLDNNSKIELLTDHYKSLRQYLAKLAFTAFSQQQLILTTQDITSVLKEFNVPLIEISTQIKALLDLGLLKTILDEKTYTETNYEFLHLTFQEYYSGRYLLWQVENGSQTLIEDFSRIKLDPRYQIVLWFVAGTIKDKNKFNLFMRAIAAPQGGDMLGNVQLGLMIRCTEENWDLAKQTGWSSVITTMLQQRVYRTFERYQRGQIDKPQIWISMLKISGNGYLKQIGNSDLFTEIPFRTIYFNEYDHNDKNIPGFIGWLGIINSKVLFSLPRLLDKFPEATADAISKLGIPAATPEVLKKLPGLLDNSSRVRESAIRAISALGSTVATPMFLAKLAQILCSRHSKIREAVRNSIEIIGAAAITPEFLMQLTDMLVYYDERVRIEERTSQMEIFFSYLMTIIDDSDNHRTIDHVCSDIAGVIRNCGKIAKPSPQLLAQFLKMMEHNNLFVQNAATDAIGNIGAAAATPPILTQLAKQLGVKSNSALSAVLKLGAAAADADIQTQLTILLKGSVDLRVQAKAALALARTGATPNVLEYLRQCFILLDEIRKDLPEEDRTLANIRQLAIDTVHSFGPTAATPEIIAHLIIMLADKNTDVSNSAKRTIVNFGTVVATLEFLEQLTMTLLEINKNPHNSTNDAVENCDLLFTTTKTPHQQIKILANRDLNVGRKSIILAISFLAVEVCNRSEIQQLLFNMLANENSDLRIAATLAFTQYNVTTNTPKFLPQVPKLLVDSNESVRSIATMFIAKIGATLAPELFVTHLSSLLTNSYSEVRELTANSISHVIESSTIDSILGQLLNLLKNSNSKVRKSACDAIGELGAVAATNDILAQISQLLADSDWEVRDSACDTVGKLGAVAATNEILVQLSQRLSENNEYVCEKVLDAVCKLGSAVVTNEFLTQISQLLATSNWRVRKAAVEGISKLGIIAAKPSMMMLLIKLLIQEKPAAAKPLSKLTILYLTHDTQSILPENNDFPLLSTAIIVGSYLSGNIGFYIDHDAKKSHYYFRGFADKTPFNIPISHAQAQWFVYWTPKIIQNFDAGKLDQVATAIEKTGMSSSSKNSIAWFDNLSLASSASSSTMPSYSANNPREFKRAYGLSEDDVVEETPSSNCVIM